MSKRKINVIEGVIPIKGQFLKPVEKCAIEKLMGPQDPLSLLNLELLSDAQDSTDKNISYNPVISSRSNFNNGAKRNNNALDPFKRRYNPGTCLFNTSNKSIIDSTNTSERTIVSIKTDKQYCNYCGSSNVVSEQPLISDISKLETWGSNNKDEKTDIHSLCNEVTYKCLNCFRHV